MAKNRTIPMLALVAVVGSPLVIEGQDYPCEGHGLYEPYGMFSRLRVGAAYLIDAHLSQDVRFAQAYTGGDGSGGTAAVHAPTMVMSAPGNSISEIREDDDRKPVFLAAHAAQGALLTYLREPCYTPSAGGSQGRTLPSGYYDLELLQQWSSSLEGVAPGPRDVQGSGTVGTVNREGIFYTWDPNEVVPFSDASSESPGGR